MNSDIELVLKLSLINLDVEGKVLDDVVTTFGIRDVKFISHKGLYVNGKETKLNGVCIHQDGGCVGVAVPPKVLIYRIKKLKSIGCNAIRTGHNPLSPEFYDICDSLGMFVYDEVLDEWKDGWPFNSTENTQGKAKNGYHLYFDQWVNTDVSDILYRDRNHPSIIFYGLGNEVPDFRHNNESAQKKFDELFNICQKIDPTRPVLLGNCNGQMGINHNQKIIGFNSVAMNFNKELDPADYYKFDYEKRPDCLFLASESTIDPNYYIAYRDNPYVLGMFLWTGFNYFGEVKGGPELGLRGWEASLFDMSANMLSQGALMASCWMKEPVIYPTTYLSSLENKTRIVKITQEKVKETIDTPNWNYEKGDSVFVKAYTNCQEAELLINGISIGRHKIGKNEFSSLWCVPYEAGKLEVVGYNNGREMTRRELKTSGKAAMIQAKPIWKNIKKDGLDVDLIELTITDKEGLWVTNAINEVNVKVTGGAEFIGIDTGNLYYTGSYRSHKRKATKGKLLVVIRSNGLDMPVTVKCTSKNLKSAIVKIK